MAYLINKYHTTDRSACLTDPISNYGYKSTSTVPPTLQGTDVISSKIRDCLSTSTRVSTRDIAQKYSQYFTTNSNANNAQYPPRLDLYGATDKRPAAREDRTYPSRINEGHNNLFPPSTTYNSTYGVAFKSVGNSNRSASSSNSEVYKVSQATKTIRKEPASPYTIRRVPSPPALSPTVKEDYAPPDATLRSKRCGSDEYYMKKLGELLNVHCGPLFTSSPSKVTEYMYVGGYKDAENWQNLRRLGITHVLNMAAMRRSTLNPYPSCSGIVGYEAIDADDHEMYNVMQHFPKAKLFIDRARLSGGKVLVHCAMGVNRSGTMCCAYLMSEHKLTLMEAARKMKRARGTTLCNRSFQKQLLNYARRNSLLE